MKEEFKILLLWISSISFFFSVAVFFPFLVSIDYLDEHSVFNDEDCVRITSFDSSEDQTRYNNNSVLMTAWKVVNHKPGEKRPGAIYVASGFDNSGTAKSTKEFVEKNLVIEKLPISDYPVGVDFHPHGIYIHKPENTLYVINHAYEKGGERIDVFQISTSDDGDDDPDNDVPNKLLYKYSITSDWMKNEMNGILNSLVVVETNKFYVTQWKPHAEDRSEDGWLDNNKKEKLELAKTLFFDSKATYVWYCEYDKDRSSTELPPLMCKKVADGFLMANGITHNPGYSEIYVADLLDKSITIFDRDASTNDLSRQGYTKVPGWVDNIKFDETSGKIYGAGITNMFQSLKNYMSNPKKEFETSTSGVFELSHELNKDRSLDWKARGLLSTSKFPMASNGIRVNNHYLMGSPFGFKGILVCPVVDANEDADSSTASNPEL